MSADPVVSIITPAFNAARFLEPMLESVVQQSRKDFEHVVVDDGSNDNTAAMLRSAADRDSRLVPVLLTDNVGAIRARNIAIERARGRYLAFLDADDLWLPEKLARQLRFMSETNVAMSYTDYRHMSLDGSLVGNLIKGPDSIDWVGHHKTRFVGCLTVMIDRSKFPDFRFPHVDPAVRGEDFLAWADALKATGKALRCPGDLARYRLVPQSRSSSKIRAARSIWRIYREVEKISLPRSSWYFANYLINASYKFLRARPAKAAVQTAE
jgi:teichuronic acid biosynthesis glycosyltransferase TuaG